MKKLLVLVNENTKAISHYEAVIEYFNENLAVPYDFEVRNIDETGNFNVFNESIYIVYWCKDVGRTSRKKFIPALMQYVVNGGSVLGFDQGIASIQPKEIQFLFNAGFINSMDEEMVEFKKTKVHQISAGFETLKCITKLNAFEFDSSANTEELIVGRYGNQTYPLLWVNTYGLGRIAGFAASSEASLLENKAIKTLLGRTGLWLQGKI